MPINSRYTVFIALASGSSFLESYKKLGVFSMFWLLAWEIGASSFMRGSLWGERRSFVKGSIGLGGPLKLSHFLWRACHGSLAGYGTLIPSTYNFMHGSFS